MALVYKNNLKCNYREFKLFWNVEDSQIKQKHKTMILNNIKRGILIPKLFLYLMPFTCVIYLYKIFKNFQVHLPPFVPERYRFKFVPYLVRLAISLFPFLNAPFVLGFDTIIICNFVYLEAQFDLLAYRLNDVINGAKLNKRRKLIASMKYHCFLLKFVHCKKY